MLCREVFHRLHRPFRRGGGAVAPGSLWAPGRAGLKGKGRQWNKELAHCELPKEAQPSCQPKQRVLLRTRAWLSNGLRHPAWGPDRGHPGKSKSHSRDKKWGHGPWRAVGRLQVLNWLGDLERVVPCPPGGLDSALAQLCDVRQFPLLSGPQLSHVQGRVTSKVHPSTDISYRFLARKALFYQPSFSLEQLLTQIGTQQNSS